MQKKRRSSNAIVHITWNLFGEDLDISFHSRIRSEEACYASLLFGSRRTGSSHRRPSAYPASFYSQGADVASQRHSAFPETNHGRSLYIIFWFTDADYARLGNLIKWNPSVKTAADRKALRDAVNNQTPDIVATDHAPHLLQEKQGSCLTAASGGPLIQHSLVAMLEMARQGIFTPEKVEGEDVAFAGRTLSCGETWFHSSGLLCRSGPW